MKYKEYYKLISNIKGPSVVPEFNTKGKLVICLIEYRIMKEIEYVINALLKVYDSQDIGLSIVYGNINSNYINSVFSKWKNIKLIKTNDDNLDRNTYSRMLKRPQFWENFKNWSNILIYQTDALLLRKIDDFYFNYDYIGAPWERIDNWNGKVIPKYNGGNGGFSLRNIVKMIECCEENRNKHVIPSGNEDAYFCTFDLKYIEAKSENHINFSMETIYSENPVGVHQIYRYIDDIMNDDEKNNFLRKINEKLLY